MSIFKFKSWIPLLILVSCQSSFAQGEKLEDYFKLRIPADIKNLILSHISPETSFDEIDYTQVRSTLRHHKVIFFFDWDDTLLQKNTVLKGANGHFRNPDFKDEDLKNTEKAVKTLLERALQFGRVHIVTNAEQGWVELAAPIAYPEVVPLFSRLGIHSARTQYEDKFPDSYVQWKQSTFESILKKEVDVDSDFTDIIAMGDSTVEREAIQNATRGMPNTLLKSIKFEEHPSLAHLRNEIEFVAKNLDFILDRLGSMDTQLTVTETHSDAPPPYSP